MSFLWNIPSIKHLLLGTLKVNKKQCEKLKGIHSILMNAHNLLFFFLN